MSDIIGLRVRLRPCRHCQCIAARIAENAALTCLSCSGERGHLDHETQTFLTQLVAVFGRPTSPIDIRETSSTPSGAGMDDVINRAG